MNMSPRDFKFLMSLIIILVAVQLPVFHLNLDSSTYLSVFSLLFAILIGFFIATATTNYLRLQTLIAEEDASLITISNLVKNISPQATGVVEEAIDDYAIAALSFEMIDYVTKTYQEFEDLSKAIDAVSPNNDKGLQLIQSLHDKKNALYQTRQEIALVARRIVTPGHWVVVISLGSLIGFLVLALRDGGLISTIISGVLLTTIYLVLTLLNEVDNNRFLEQALSYQTSQQIFRAIGRPPYYVEDVIESGRVDKPKTSYRTGYYKSPSDKDIRLIDPAVR